MIRTNLLPYHLRPVKRTPLPYIVSLLVLLMAIAAMAMLLLSALAQVSQKRTVMQQHRDEFQKLKPIVDEYNELSTQKESFAGKVDVIQEIVSDRIIWSRQLWNLSRLMPENFWLKSITETEKPFKEQKLVYDEKTKKEELKVVTVKRRVLEVGGYVIKGADGTASMNPLVFATQQDPEFSSLFQISMPKLKDTEFEKTEVREFTVEYVVQDTKSKEEAAKDKDEKQGAPSDAKSQGGK
jgi:hypothetical protein